MNAGKAHDAYVMVLTKNYNASSSVRDSGPASGWIYDNRGGFPRSTVEDGYSILNDVSDKYGTALIRPINEITEGIITVETGLTTTGSGVSVEYRDIGGNTTYKIKLIDDSWCILGKDGGYDVILKDAFSKENDTFSFRISIDLDKCVSHTFINDIFCGTHPLLSDSAENFRFATDEESTIAVTPAPLIMYGNYHVFEDFSRFRPLSVYGWSCSDTVSVEGEEMVIDTGKAVKAFSAVSENVSFQCHFKNKFAQNTLMSLNCGDKTLIKVEYKDNVLYANGKELYRCRFSDMWHRLRINADTDTGVADILLNGRSKGRIEFDKKVYFDNLVLESAGGISSFDFIKLYNTVEHEDYVPAPLSKANTDDYIVGMNICSMWVNASSHFGWSVVTPYKEHEPYLGFYDEGNPETADWEIKYMVERGIDYQAFCWYGGYSNGYLKNPYLSDQLHEGFQYAKYSDRMYYTIMWETWMKVATLEQFKNIIVPYWFENYFLDDRYLKIDNKIVCYIYAPQSLRMDNLFGSMEGAQEALRYIEEMAKSFGFDGVLFIESGVYNASTESALPAKEMGFDASVCYHWFGNGYLPEHNISNITIAEHNKKTHFIPTPSSGYDGYVWRKKTEDPVRRPVAVEEDMYKVCKWIKEDYLPKYKDEAESWKHKMVMFSTWNEYGEGTFIMPSGINGFGQLDAIDRAFTNGGGKEALIPTPNQRKRINHLYPQNVTLLRRYGYYVKSSIKDGQESVLCEYSPCKKTAGGVVNYTLTSGKCDIRLASQLEIKLKGKVGTKVKISFTTADELEFSDTKSFTVTIDSEKEKLYFINTRENYRFGESFVTPPEQHRYSFGLIKLKAESDGEGVEYGDITVRSFIGNGVAAKDYSLIVNGTGPVSDIYPEKAGDRIYFPFDPDTGIDFMINSLISYNRYKEELTISTTDHTGVFTRGQSKYVLDGKEKDLGYTLWFTDGIPMFDFEKLSQDFGFEYEWQDNILKITSEQSCEFDIYGLSDHDFIFSNNMLHGWSSPQMTLIPGKDSMLAKKALNTSDPQLYRYGTGFDASVYTKLLLCIRYKHVRQGPNQLEIFFDTNKAKGFCAERCIKVPLEVNDTGDEWKEFEIDLTKVDGWQDTITDLRLDPFTSSGQMEFRYIRFIEE